MEDWATLALVVGSNAIMGGASWLVARMQVKRSEHELERKLENEREVDKHERAREVRGEVLLKLRNELARMAGKGEKVGSIGMMAPSFREVPEEFEGALLDWSAYMASGEFEKALFMQYDSRLVFSVDSIRLDYEIARRRFQIYWLLSDEGGKKEHYDKGVELIKENRSKVVEVQSEISKMLEGL